MLRTAANTRPNPLVQARTVLNYAVGIPSRGVATMARNLAAQPPGPAWFAQVEKLRAHMVHEGLVPETLDWQRSIRVPRRRRKKGALGFFGGTTGTLTGEVFKALFAVGLSLGAIWLVMRLVESMPSERRRS